MSTMTAEEFKHSLFRANSYLLSKPIDSEIQRERSRILKIVLQCHWGQMNGSNRISFSVGS